VAAKIQRRFTTSLVTIALTIALTLPVEVVLLEALATPEEDVAIQEWVEGLSIDDLDRVADRVAFYPVAYRKPVLGALTPIRRSEVWRDHIRTYIAERPGLSDDVIPALEAAIELATPQALSTPSAADRAHTIRVAIADDAVPEDPPTREAMLKLSKPRLCQQCHIPNRHPTEARLPQNRFVISSSCVQCHSNIHGSNHPSGFAFTR